MRAARRPANRGIERINALLVAAVAAGIALISVATVDDIRIIKAHASAYRDSVVVRSEAAGTIASIEVAMGRIVDQNATLITIDREPDAQAERIRLGLAALGAERECDADRIGVATVVDAETDARIQAIVMAERARCAEREAELAAEFGASRRRVRLATIGLERSQATTDRLKAKLGTAHGMLEIARLEQTMASIATVRRLINPQAADEIAPSTDDLLTLSPDTVAGLELAEIETAALLRQAEMEKSAYEAEIADAESSHARSGDEARASAAARAARIGQESAVLVRMLRLRGSPPDRAVARSPVEGIIKRLTTAPIGATIAVGDELAEVGPLARGLALRSQPMIEDAAVIGGPVEASVALAGDRRAIKGWLASACDMPAARRRARCALVIEPDMSDDGVGERLVGIAPGTPAVIEAHVGRPTVLRYLLGWPAGEVHATRPTPAL